MKIFLSILFNSLILFAIVYFLPFNGLEGVRASGDFKLYFTGGVILGILNFIIKPLLKIIGLPFLFITFGLFIVVINGIILYLLEGIIKHLNINGVSFEIKGALNFVIAVAILTLFNTIYNTFFKNN